MRYGGGIRQQMATSASTALALKTIYKTLLRGEKQTPYRHEGKQPYSCGAMKAWRLSRGDVALAATHGMPRI